MGPDAPCTVSLNRLHGGTCAAIEPDMCCGCMRLLVISLRVYDLSLADGGHRQQRMHA